MVYDMTKLAGGDLRLANTPNGGSVSLRLPYRPACLVESGMALLVEDSDSLRSLFRDMLIALRYTVIEAASADEACNHRRKVFSGVVRFDLTLTPAGPPSDGFAACSVSMEPVSGHKLDENGEPRLMAGDSMQVTMAELTPGVWAPHFLGFRTPIGTLAFERK